MLLQSTAQGRRLLLPMAMLFSVLLPLGWRKSSKAVSERRSRMARRATDDDLPHAMRLRSESESFWMELESSNRVLGSCTLPKISRAALGFPEKLYIFGCFRGDDSTEMSCIIGEILTEAYKPLHSPYSS